MRNNRLLVKERLLGIKGLRGVGKTTILLQYFYQHTLFDLAVEWYRNGGELLLIDEIHKYSNWSRELKLIYDGHPNLKIIFTSSSALDLYRGESDLSRRLITQTLHGMSFREYLSLKHGIFFEQIELDHLLEESRGISIQISSAIKPLPLFSQYLQEGYFPFSSLGDSNTIRQRLIQVINTVLESDLSYIQDYSASTINKIKKLLGVIAGVAPFEPNISKIAQKLNLGRDTVNHYLRHLHDAYILILANKPNKGISHLQKPDKIYIENASFAYALQNNPVRGTLRETFFINQLRNAGHLVNLSEKADFLVNGNLVFEIAGGTKKGNRLKEFPIVFSRWMISKPDLVIKSLFGCSGSYISTMKRFGLLKFLAFGFILIGISCNPQPRNKDEDKAATPAANSVSVPSKPASTLQILFPKGGEKLIKGETYILKWEGGAEKVSIFLVDSSLTFIRI